MRRACVTALLALVLAVLSGCSFDIGFGGGEDDVPDKVAGDEAVDTFPRGAIARTVNERMKAEPGAKLDPGTVQCPALKKEVGARATCVRSSERDGMYATIDINVEVTESQGETFNLHYEVASEPTTFGMRGDKIEKAITKEARQHYGAVPSTVECPDLEGVPGGEVTCSMTVLGMEKTITAAATDVDRSTTSMEVSLSEMASSS